jgi:hypothetical protein
LGGHIYQFTVNPQVAYSHVPARADGAKRHVPILPTGAVLKADD